MSTKIREMIVASRLEATLSKDEILELYLNSAYLGRGSWGVEMAARSYFGKSAKEVTLAEAAMLWPAQRTELLRSRPSFRSRQGTPHICARPHARGRRNRRTAKRERARQRAKGDRLSPGRAAIAAFSSSIFSHARHRSTDRESDRRHTRCTRRSTRSYNGTPKRHCRKDWRNMKFFRPGRVARDRGEHCGCCTKAGRKCQRRHAGLATGAKGPAPCRSTTYTGHPPVVLQKGQSIRVGLPDGRTGPLAGLTADAARNLNLYDVAYVHVRARTAVRPKVARSGRAKAAFRRGFEYDRRCRERPLCWKTQPGASWQWRAALSSPLSQPTRTLADQASARLDDQTVTYLTALQKDCSLTPWCG